MKKIFKFYIPLLVAITSLLAVNFVYAKAVDGRKAALLKPASLETETVDGNRIYNWVNNRGAWSCHNVPIGFGISCFAI